MTWWILLILVFMFIVLVWHSAIHHALLDTPDSVLERHLAQTGRLERDRWLIVKQRGLAALAAMKQAGDKVVILGLVFVDLCVIGDGAGFTFWRVVASILIGLGLIWIASGVLGVALARYSGAGLITSIALPLRFAWSMGKPFILVNNFFDEAFRRLTGANLRQRDAEEELLRSIEESQRKGELDEVAAEMLENVVEFVDTDVSSVMTPRTDIDGIEYTDDLSAIRSFIEDAGHSRIPVYRENLDEIEGILYVKDLIRYLGEEAANFELRPLLRETLRVPETKHVGDLLRDFQTAEIHMAIVIDEYGGTSGLITIEDVLEEIVGEIHDEHEPDDEEEATCTQVGPDAWEVDGRFPLHDLEDHLQIDLPEDLEPETVAGLVLEHFGRVPDPQEAFDAYGHRFSVLESNEIRVDRVRILREEVQGHQASAANGRGA